MRWIWTLMAVLVCGACQPEPSQRQIAELSGQPQPLQGQQALECRDFTAPVTAGGKPEQASGWVCQQPDGSWRVVQQTPGLPAQGYVVPPSSRAAVGAGTAVGDQNPCSNFTVPVTVGGQQQQAVVESCRQPDGSWRITQDTPGLPQQVYTVPPPPSDNAYPYPDYYAYPFADSYWFASPWFFGLGPTIFVTKRFPHFHHGFAHGFHPGFSPGFHGGFHHAGGMGGHHR